MRDLIYETDKWTSYLWRSATKSSPALRALVERGAQKISTFDGFAREVFARLYNEPPTLANPRPEDAWARTLHTGLDELDAWKKLRAYATYNKELAAAATATLLEQLIGQLPETKAPLKDPDEKRAEVKGLMDFLKGLAPHEPLPGSAASPHDLAQALADARAAGADAVAQMSAFAARLDPEAVRGALRATMEDAAQDAEETATATAALLSLGGTSGPGGTLGPSDTTLTAVAQAVRSSDSMKRLALLAGRMRRIAMNKRRSRTKSSASEVSDITTGRDLQRLLPHELLKLTDPLLSLDFMRGFLEGSLLQYELSGKEREGRGPVVVLIDDSDSMDGPRSTFARAAALALADLALAERRACKLVLFSHEVKSSVLLRPGTQPTSELLEFLSSPVAGGTNFELPLIHARATVDSEPLCERADVVLITDGEAELSPAFLADWHARSKTDGLSTYAVHIGGEAPSLLKALTAEIIALPSLVPERLDDTLFGALLK